MRYVIGVAMIFAGFFLLIMIMGASAGSGGIIGGMWAISILMDMPSLFPFVIVVIAVIIATGNRKTFIASINAILSKKYTISAANKEAAIRLYKLLGKSVTYTAAMSITAALMLMLTQLEDPSLLGPMISAALISVFYGAFINLAFIYPAIHILETRYNAEEKTVISEKQVVDKLLEMCYKQGITPEEILEATELSVHKRQ